VVTVADASLLDYETATSHTITVQATSSDGSAQTKAFTIGLTDDTGEFSVSAVSDTDATVNTVSESASNGDTVGVTAFASDADGSDSVSYSLTDNAGGRFAIDASTGVVTVADASLLDYETATSHTISVQATSSDGSTQTQSFTVALSDDTSEFSVSAVSDTDATGNTVSESASNGDTVGIAAFASDADASDTVTYSLTDDAGGRFAIDAATGVVTVADASLLDYETATSHTITVQATSSDGSTQTQAFTIGLSDDTSEFSVSAVSDTDAAANTVSESTSDGDTVGVTAFASDADATDTVTYSLTDNAGGRFAIDAATGVVTVADASLLDYETAVSHGITVQATSSDGSTETQSYTIALSDDTSEFSVSAVTDADAAANTVSEHASNGDTVGITGFASDADASDAVIYSLTDDSGGRFAIDAATGVVTVADASLLDYDTADSHTISVLATSSDGSTETHDFSIAVTTDYNEMSGPGFVIGTDGADRITGTDLSESKGGEEIMLGMGGDDVLLGGGNEDRLIGGEGNDTLSGGDQSDVLAGGTGDDTADGGSGDDIYVFRMGDGHDTFSGGSGHDAILLMGTEGGSPDPSDWSLNLTSGSASWSMDHVSLTSGAAGTITFTDGSSVAFDGVETIDFSGSSDVDHTGRVTIADAGGDTVNGGNEEDTIFGGSGADTLKGGGGEDLLMGGGGADALYGGNDNDVLYGEGGNDTLYGDKGDDVLVGGDGGDTLYGGQGNDVLYGDAGNDTLYGEDGNDTLYGGAGDDAAYGGKGDDTFVFGAGMGHDSFAGGGGAWTDTIQLSGVDGVTAYNGWTLAGAAVVDSGAGYIDLAADSDGTITMDDGSQVSFTDVDRIEW
jgi:RTX calcium-binding nonapeptide repeat (4 copies)/Cadherin domain